MILISTYLLILLLLIIGSIYLYINLTTKKYLNKNIESLTELNQLTKNWISQINKPNLKSTILLVIVLKLFFLILKKFTDYNEVIFIAIIWGAFSNYIITRLMSSSKIHLQNKINHILILKTQLTSRITSLSSIFLFSIYIISWFISYEVLHYSLNFCIKTNLLNISSEMNYYSLAGVDKFNHINIYISKLKIFYIIGFLIASCFTTLKDLIYSNSAKIANTIGCQTHHYMSEDTIKNPLSILCYISNSFTNIKSFSFLLIIIVFSYETIHHFVLSIFQINIVFKDNSIFTLILSLTITTIIAYIIKVFLQKKNISQIMIYLGSLATLYLINIFIVHEPYILYIISTSITLSFIFLITLKYFSKTYLNQLKNNHSNTDSSHTSLTSNLSTGIYLGTLLPIYLIISLTMITIINNIYQANIWLSISYYFYGHIPFILSNTIDLFNKTLESDIKKTAHILNIPFQQNLSYEENTTFDKVFILKSCVLFNIITAIDIIIIINFNNLINSIKLKSNLAYYNFQNNPTELLFNLQTFNNINLQILNYKLFLGFILAVLLILLIILISLKYTKQTINKFLNYSLATLNKENQETKQIDFTKIFNIAQKTTKIPNIVPILFFIISPLTLNFFIDTEGIIGMIIAITIILLLLSCIFIFSGYILIISKSPNKKTELPTFTEEKNIINKNLGYIFLNILTPILLIASTLLLLMLTKTNIISIFGDIVVR